MRLKQTILTLLLAFIGMSAMAQSGNLMRGDVKLAVVLTGSKPC